MKEIVIMLAGAVVLFATPPLAGRLGAALAKRRTASGKRRGATQLDAGATPGEPRRRQPKPALRSRKGQSQIPALENLI